MLYIENPHVLPGVLDFFRTVEFFQGFRGEAAAVVGDRDIDVLGIFGF